MGKQQFIMLFAAQATNSWHDHYPSYVSYSVWLLDDVHPIRTSFDGRPQVDKISTFYRSELHAVATLFAGHDIYLATLYLQPCTHLLH